MYNIIHIMYDSLYNESCIMTYNSYPILGFKKNSADYALTHNYLQCTSSQ